MTMNNITILADKLVNNKWLLNANAHQRLSKMVGSVMAGKMQMVENQSIPIQLDQPLTDTVTAVIDINGILVKGASQMECSTFGLMDIDYIRNCLDDAAADDTVTEILLNINSPGGEVTGIEELGRHILEIDKKKPIFAFTSTMMCSAAYWIACQCRSIAATPSSTVGSIGVYSLIEDTSKALEMEGINIQSIYAGKYKLLGNNFRALTDDERSILQKDVDDQHTKFKTAVLVRRKVQDEFMEGLSYSGVDALNANLVDVVVDDIEKYIITLTSKDLQNIMKNEPTKTMAANVAEAEIPGVPTTDKNTETCCPHCGKKASDPVEPHPEPDGDEVEPKNDTDEKAKMTAPETKLEMTAENWNKVRGFPAVSKNAFVEAAYSMVMNFKH